MNKNSTIGLVPNFIFKVEIVNNASGPNTAIIKVQIYFITPCKFCLNYNVTIKCNIRRLSLESVIATDEDKLKDSPTKITEEGDFENKDEGKSGIIRIERWGDPPE